ncbi:hypothetical protein CPB85DRAFT_646360 [Mucidula mucida]|nr:hypothetical protein CPB85DRAFT_646360 [Mucidula mucida]
MQQSSGLDALSNVCCLMELPWSRGQYNSQCGCCHQILRSGPSRYIVRRMIATTLWHPLHFPRPSVSLKCLLLPPFPTTSQSLLLLGHFFNWALFGILCVQAYIYYLAFPNDRLWPTKALTIFVFILELAQTVVNTRDALR